MHASTEHMLFFTSGGWQKQFECSAKRKFFRNKKLGKTQVSDSLPSPKPKKCSVHANGHHQEEIVSTFKRKFHVRYEFLHAM